MEFVCVVGGARHTCQRSRPGNLTSSFGLIGFSPCWSNSENTNILSRLFVLPLNKTNFLEPNINGMSTFSPRRKFARSQHRAFKLDNRTPLAILELYNQKIFADNHVTVIAVPCVALPYVMRNDITRWSQVRQYQPRDTGTFRNRANICN